MLVIPCERTVWDSVLKNICYSFAGTVWYVKTTSFVVVLVVNIPANTSLTVWPRKFAQHTSVTSRRDVDLLTSTEYFVPHFCAVSNLLLVSWHGILIKKSMRSRRVEFIKCICALGVCVCVCVCVSALKRACVLACVRASAERKLNLETRCGNVGAYGRRLPRRATVAVFVVVVEKLRGGWEPASSQNTHTQSAGDPLFDTHPHTQTPALIQYNQSLYNNNNTLSLVLLLAPPPTLSPLPSSPIRWCWRHAYARPEMFGDDGSRACTRTHAKYLRSVRPTMRTGVPGSLCLNQICSDKTELG